MDRSADDRSFAKELQLKPGSPRKDPSVAGLLSFCISGAGNLYNGTASKGIVVMLVVLVCLFTVVGLIIGVPIWVWNILDAVNEAKRINNIIETLEQENAAKEKSQIAQNENAVKQLADSTLKIEDFKKTLKQSSALLTEGVIARDEFDKRIMDLVAQLTNRERNADADDYLLAALEFKKAGILTDENLKALKLAMI